MKEQELALAIADPKFEKKIRETRISTPDERSNTDRLRMVREAMEKANALGQDKAGKKNRARLELALDDIRELMKLEETWMSKEDRARLGEWIYEDEFIAHPEAMHILRFIIEKYRSDLSRFKIAILMQKEVPPVNRRGRLGTAMKLPGKMKFLSQVDACVTLNHSNWRTLSDKDRQRLIHHELEHLEVNQENARLQLRAHDFEDFANIVVIYGLRSESGIFNTDGRSADALEAWTSQLELIND